MWSRLLDNVWGLAYDARMATNANAAVAVAIRTMRDRLSALEEEAAQIEAEKRQILSAIRSLGRSDRGVEDEAAPPAKRPKGQNLQEVTDLMVRNPDRDFSPKEIHAEIGIAASSAQAVFRRHADHFVRSARGAYKLRNADIG